MTDEVKCQRCGYTEKDAHHNRALWEQAHEHDGRELEWCIGFLAPRFPRMVNDPTPTSKPLIILQIEDLVILARGDDIERSVRVHADANVRHFLQEHFHDRR